MTTLSHIIILFSVFSDVVCDPYTNTGNSFTVTRGVADSFPNPDCDSTTCPNICARYNAKCSLMDESTYPCNICYCNAKTGKYTYVGSSSEDGNRCEGVKDIVKESVPKEKVSIVSRYTNYRGTPVYKCMAVHPKLFLKDKGDCDVSEVAKGIAWIYTKPGRFMNLNRLNCLTVGPGDEIMVSPCKLNDNKQQWFCDSSGNILFHRERDGSRMYINPELILTNFSYSEWTGFRSANSCPKQLEYQGCYRFNDGSLMRILEFYPKGKCESAKSCFTAMKVLAPIYEENSNCFINWQTSLGDLYSRGIYVKIPYTSYANWSGKVLRLQVNCSSRTTSEEHCVLIKFPSKIESFDNIRDNPNIGPNGKDEGKKKSKSSNAYKISTIVLSVLVFLILLSIVVYFAMRSSMCKKLTRSRHHRGAEIPFYAETDAEPAEM